MRPEVLLRPSEYAVLVESAGGTEKNVRLNLPGGTKLYERGGGGYLDRVVTVTGKGDFVGGGGRIRGPEGTYAIGKIVLDDVPYALEATVTTQATTGPGGRRHRSFKGYPEAVTYLLKWLDRRYRLVALPE